MPVAAQPVLPSKIVATPSFLYYVRKDGQSPTLLGPVPYYQANAQARRMSEDSMYGAAEVFVYVGTRPGDPIMEVHQEVISMFRRGKVILAGKIATIKSKQGIPPDGYYST